MRSAQVADLANVDVAIAVDPTEIGDETLALEPCERLEDATAMPRRARLLASVAPLVKITFLGLAATRAAT